MSSNNEEGQPTSRVDIMEQQRKRQTRISNSMDWRSSNNNRLEDFDSNFRMLRDAKATQVKQEQQTLPSSLEPISREEAEKVGMSYKEMERQNLIRTIKRQQYNDSKGRRSH